MYKKIIVFYLFTVMCASCSKFLDVGVPSDNIVSEAVYQSSTSATGVLTAMYPELYTLLSGKELFFKCSLMADDFTLYGMVSGLDNYYINNNYDAEFWRKFYALLYRINSAIEGLNSATKLPINVKEQLLGEAHFLRAFCYFYLVNLYGEVPLLMASDYKENLTKSRSSVETVYESMTNDLIIAKRMLSDNYLKTDMITITEDRVRPTKDVASALLSRVYLHRKDWVKAEIEASGIIERKTKYDLVALNKVFLKNSKESIWQLQPTNFLGFNTMDARIFVLTDGPNSFRPVYLSSGLVESFESEDLRKDNWIGINFVGTNVYHYPFKYKLYNVFDIDGEYFMMLRLAEQYLIRSEARAQMNNLNGALADVNVIRTRAGLNSLGNLTKDAVLDIILKERRNEFFSEGGHRWFDLKRLERTNDIMPSACVLKGGQWLPYKQLMPVPLDDIRLNPNLTQNPGYSQ